MTTKLRAARRADLPDVYRMLESAFTDAPIQLFIDQTEGDSTLRYRHVRVADVDGRIAAHVRIFARTMLVRGVPVAAGGIGSVASSPEARGLGLPSELLRDAIRVLAAGHVPVSFLFTGIPAFYERIGWRIVRQPEFDAPAAGATHTKDHRVYRIRRVTDHDLPALLAIYRRATAGTTGAIARTPRTWREARRWLGEDAPGCLIAEQDGEPAAYLRARSREYGYQIIEAEHARGHEHTIATLVSHAAKRAIALGQELTTYAPGDHALAAALRALPGMRESTDVRYPVMMRIVSLRPLVEALLPKLDAAANRDRGAAFTLGLHAPGDQALTLRVRGASVRIGGAAPQYTLDEAGTLDAVLGQRHASELVRPRPSAAVRQRIDVLLPEAAFHFWNSDRI